MFLYCDNWIKFETFVKFFLFWNLLSYILFKVGKGEFFFGSFLVGGNYN